MKSLFSFSNERWLSSPGSSDRIVRATTITRQSGFTFIEMMAVMIIVGALASLAIPRVQQSIKRARVARATGDIDALQSEIEGFRSVADTLPATLAAIGRAGFTDPWGNPYRYDRPASKTDQFSMQLNTSYDLYSAGVDGATSQSIAASASQDDIVRANDGGFIGLAKVY